MSLSVCWPLNNVITAFHKATTRQWKHAIEAAASVLQDITLSKERTFSKKKKTTF